MYQGEHRVKKSPGEEREESKRKFHEVRGANTKYALDFEDE